MRQACVQHGHDTTTTAPRTCRPCCEPHPQVPGKTYKHHLRGLVLCASPPSMAWARATLPAVAMALYGCLLSQGLSRWQHGLLEVGEPLASGDVAVVLGHALDREGTPSYALQRRIDAGLQLLRKGSVGAVLFSGGHDGSGLRSW